MNPQKGQTIQIQFNNTQRLDATVEEWSDKKSVLRLLGSNDIVVIQKTLQDVMLVRIMSEKTISQPSTDKIREQILNKFNELKQQPGQTDLHKVADLKNQLNQIEREEILEKSRSFIPSGAREISYELPRNIKVASSPQYTSQEASTEDFGFSQELQRLFNKEH